MPSDVAAGARPRGVVLALLAAVACGAVVALTLLVVSHPIAGADVRLSRLVQQVPTATGVSLMRAVSLFGSTVVMVPLTAAAAAGLAVAGLRRTAAYLVSVSLVMVAITQAMKAAVGRPRPAPELVAVFDRPIDASFPSGHVTAVVVFTGFLAFVLVLDRDHVSLGWKIVTAVAALGVLCAVGLSRVYLGAHWVSDVVGGYLVAGLVLAVTVALWVRNDPRRAAREHADAPDPHSSKGDADGLQ